MSTDLTITSEQKRFTEQQLAGLRQLGVEDASEGDLAVFFHQCQRTGLDPFSRQIYMIGRRDRRSGTVKQSMTISIDGARVIAARRAERMGVPLSIGAALLADPRTGEWREVLPTGLVPLAAKITVKLGEGVFEAIARMDEYMPMYNGKPTGMWAKMPATMIGKCAESLALRKACPMDLSGLYTSEEMEQADAHSHAEASPADSSADVPAHATVTVASDEQVAALGEWADTIGLTPAKFTEGVIHFSRKRGHEVVEAAEMTADAAADMLTHMRVVYERQQAERSAQAGSEPIQGEIVLGEQTGGEL